MRSSSGGPSMADSITKTGAAWQAEVRHAADLML